MKSKILLVVSLFILISCNQIANKLGYERVNNDSETKDNTIKEQQKNPRPTPTVVKTFNVKAQIYHFIGDAYNGHEKATNKYATLKIEVYSDRTIYCTSMSFPERVRYSETAGFDYECNDGNTIYKFNTDEL